MTPASFWSRVAKADGCWLWTGSKYRYGLAYLGSRPMGAHRVSWILTNGPIEGRLDVCHRCDNTLCVRPDHLFLGTRKENMADCKSKGRNATGDRVRPRSGYKYGDDNPSRRHPGRMRRGSACAHSKLNESLVAEMRRAHRSGETQRSIARRTGVDYRQVNAVVLGKTWKHVDCERLEDGLTRYRLVLP